MYCDFNKIVCNLYHCYDFFSDNLDISEKAKFVKLYLRCVNDLILYNKYKVLCC